MGFPSLRTLGAVGAGVSKFRDGQTRRSVAEAQLENVRSQIDDRKFKREEAERKQKLDENDKKFLAGWTDEATALLAGIKDKDNAQAAIGEMNQWLQINAKNASPKLAKDMTSFLEKFSSLANGQADRFVSNRNAKGKEFSGELGSRFGVNTLDVGSDFNAKFGEYEQSITPAERSKLQGLGIDPEEFIRNKKQSDSAEFQKRQSQALIDERRRLEIKALKESNENIKIRKHQNEVKAQLSTHEKYRTNIKSLVDSTVGPERGFDFAKAMAVMKASEEGTATPDEERAVEEMLEEAFNQTHADPTFNQLPHAANMKAKAFILSYKTDIRKKKQQAEKVKTQPNPFQGRILRIDTLQRMADKVNEKRVAEGKVPVTAADVAEEALKDPTKNWSAPQRKEMEKVVAEAKAAKANRTPEQKEVHDAGVFLKKFYEETKKPGGGESHKMEARIEEIEKDPKLIEAILKAGFPKQIMGKIIPLPVPEEQSAAPTARERAQGVADVRDNVLGAVAAGPGKVVDRMAAGGAGVQALGHGAMQMGQDAVTGVASAIGDAATASSPTTVLMQVAGAEANSLTAPERQEVMNLLMSVPPNQRVAVWEQWYAENKGGSGGGSMFAANAG